MTLARLGVPNGGGPLYELALTHRSYAFENGATNAHNERLEFLGDAVLGIVVTRLIYERYPDLAEGDMARLRSSVVNNEGSLAELARELNVGEHMKLGKGEDSGGGRDKPKLLADAVEALIGAVYLDRGLDAVTEHLVPLFLPRLEESLRGARFDSKTALQEIAVRETGDLPSYRVASSGPDHDKSFVAHVYLSNELYGSGVGRSKKEAEQHAAREALERLDADPNAKDVLETGGPDARAS